MSGRLSPARSEANIPGASAANHRAAEPNPDSQTSTLMQYPAQTRTHVTRGTVGSQNVRSGQQSATTRSRSKEWLAELESYISHREGSLQAADNLPLQRLRAVLAVGDELCVVVHGFVVLWVIDPQRCAELLGLSRAVVDSACETLDIVFGGIRTMRNDVLAWLVDFPPGLRSGDFDHASVVDVSRFFQRLATHWKGILRHYVQQRRLPLRHRELVGVLQLRSQNLRLTFFRWSLSFLGVYNFQENANIISVLEVKFSEDQDFYYQGHSKEEYESHDHKVAEAFSVLMSAAKRGQPGTATLSQGGAGEL